MRGGWGGWVNNRITMARMWIEQWLDLVGYEVTLEKMCFKNLSEWRSRILWANDKGITVPDCGASEGEGPFSESLSVCSWHTQYTCENSINFTFINVLTTHVVYIYFIVWVTGVWKLHASDGTVIVLGWLLTHTLVTQTMKQLYLCQMKKWIQWSYAQHS